MLRRLCLVGLLTSALAAQSPLTTLFNWNNGGAAGWTMYFDVTLNVPLTFSQFDVNLGDAASTPGSLNVYYTTSATTYVGNDTNAGAWTLGGTGALVAAGLNVPTVCAISPFTLAPGNYGFAIVHNGVSPYYTDGNGSATPGSGTNQTYSTAEMTLLAGASAGGGLGTAICCTPRVINCNVHYNVSGSGTVALRTPYGAGCYNKKASFYENFGSSAAFDLANSSIAMLPSSGGYIVLPGFNSYVAPSAAATVVTLGDDTEAPVALSTPFPHSAGTTSSLTVCSNGYVSIASGNGTGFSPTVTTMLNGSQTGWWNWHDYNPSIAGSGLVKFEQVGGVAYVTWDGVWDFGGTSAANANTFQFQFDCASGIVHLVFQTMSTLGNARLVGYSPGGPSSDPGNRDISATLAASFTLPGTDAAPLALAASARPLIGTSINMVTSNVTGTSIGISYLSLGQTPAPGIDLGIIGAPGCPALIDVNQSVGSVIGNFGAFTLSVPLAIPNNTGLLGFQLFGQSIWLDATANPFGVLTSNGVALLLGNL